MAKTNPSKDPGLFGTLFDLNGDGRTDAAEAAMMFMMFDEIQKEENHEQQARISRTYDLDDMNIEGI